MPKILFEKKNWGKPNLKLSERSEPHIPRVYRMPKAPSMRVLIKFKEEIFCIF